MDEPFFDVITYDAVFLLPNYSGLSGRFIRLRSALPTNFDEYAYFA